MKIRTDLNEKESYDGSNNSIKIKGLSNIDGGPICSHIIVGTKTKKINLKNDGDGKMTW